MNFNIVKSHHLKIDYVRYGISGGDFIYIFGAPSVGKTTMASESFVEFNDVIPIHINCNSLASPSGIYSTILRELSIRLKCKKSIKLNKLTSTPEFVGLYEKLEQESCKEGYSRIYVVLDQVELLYKTSMMDTIVALSKTQNLLLMFCSTESCDSFLNAFAGNLKGRIGDSMNVIDLTSWTKSDIIDTICKQEPTKFKILYKKFVTNIVSIFYSSITKNYVEIRNWCQMNFEKFIDFYRTRMHEIAWHEEALDPEEIFDDDQLEEYANSLGIKRSTDIIASYLVSIEGLKRPQGLSDLNKLDQDRRLNYTTGILIVAAFVAAKTRPFEDKRNFVSFQKRKVSSRAQCIKIIKRFSLERFLQIFKGLLIISDRSDSNCKCTDMKNYTKNLNNSVLSDISLLEDLKVIEIAAGDGLSPNTTYKMSSLISYAFVKRIGQQVGIEIEHLQGIKETV